MANVDTVWGAWPMRKQYASMILSLWNQNGFGELIHFLHNTHSLRKKERLTESLFCNWWQPRTTFWIPCCVLMLCIQSVTDLPPGEALMVFHAIAVKAQLWPLSMFDPLPQYFSLCSALNHLSELSWSWKEHCTVRRDNIATLYCYGSIKTLKS